MTRTLQPISSILPVLLAALSLTAEEAKSAGPKELDTQVVDARSLLGNVLCG